MELLILSGIFRYVATLLSLCDNLQDGLIPKVELKQGLLEGIEETSSKGKTFYSFLGVPYAKPPIGDLRFENPVAAESWEGTLDASKNPEMCPQIDLASLMAGITNITGSEDCLYLNIFTPKPLKPDSAFPVMVFIHGGGYYLGNAIVHGPQYLMNEDIVLVVIQYRLGILGFLSTEDQVMPGNFGLKDQQMALKWIQINIEQFGGNPNRVTIFGESAGAGSVHLHMLSPGSKDLFHGAIAQSGVSLGAWSLRNDHRYFATEFGKKFGCNLDESSEKFKSCLKQQDVEEMSKNLHMLAKWTTAPTYTIPRVDGDFLPDHPIILLKEGRYNKVDLITGITRDEGFMLVASFIMAPQLEELFIANFTTYSPYSLILEHEDDPAGLAKKIFDFYLKGKELNKDEMQKSKQELFELYTDRFFGIPMDIASHFHSKDKDMKLYLYQLNTRSQFSLADLMNITDPDTEYVTHGDDLFYMFNGLFYNKTQLFEKEEDKKISNMLIKLWTNFAKNGRPDESLDLYWTPATPSNLEYLAIQSNPVMKKDYRKERRNFWFSLDMNENRLLFNDGERVL